MSKVYTICYNDLFVFEDKESASSFFRRCYHSSEGAEQQRYSSILIGLDNNNIATDGSHSCNNIYIHNNYYTKTALKIELEESMSIGATIKYYNKKVLPILKVSENLIDFQSCVPFQDFSCDEDQDFMNSFSQFYVDLLKEKNIDINAIETNEISDGKYECIINDNIVIDLRAGDNINSVIDNIETIEKELYKEQEGISLTEF